MKGVTFHSFCYSYSKLCLLVILLAYGSAEGDENSSQIAKTIIVNPNDARYYKTVQSAIDSIPLQNQNWIRILIRSGIYKEKVTIPADKGYIYMQGRGIEKTIIAYGDHQQTDTSATFTSYASNIIITGITFKNTYNIASISSLATPTKPAVAARMLGDKYAIIDSSFDGFQDTLCDGLGRHYYKRCVISGGIDFIFGYAQSIFEGCTLKLTIGIYPPNEPYGTITAQGRQSPMDKGGFVFKDCTVIGNGKVKALLERAWEPYARVIFYHSNFGDAILPIGWDAWKGKGQEEHITFVEFGCTGVGADTSKRVPWLKKASEKDVLQFTNLTFIDEEGWLSRLPIKL
uniref:pectinesterase n=3 Tax=Arabidopsis halleri TaxID=81970 RepID=B2Y4N5_ARAHH|nr:putative pectinesterase family protein [Arabidopsis halleri subsp. halleri]